MGDTKRDRLVADAAEAVERIDADELEQAAREQERAWLIMVKVTTSINRFRDGEAQGPFELIGVVRDEIVANLESCGAWAEIVKVEETEV